MKYITYLTDTYNIIAVTDEPQINLPPRQDSVAVSYSVAAEVMGVDPEELENPDLIAEPRAPSLYIDPTKYFDGTSIITQERVQQLYLESLPQIVPHVVAAWRIKVIVELQGLEESILNAIENISDQTTKIIAKRSWNDGTEISRTSPLMLSLASGLGLTDEQLDDIFITAAKLPS